MRAQEFILESQTASADVVWNYVKRIHPDDQQGGGFLEQLIRQYPRYRLQTVPVASLIIHDQESDDPDQEPEEDPYGRVQVVDPEYAGEVSVHNLDRNPIVIDAQGHILDGNHRAWAAAELLGRDTIRAWVPVEQIAEIGNTRPEYTRPDKQRSGKHKFTTTFTGARGKQRQVDVYFFYDYNCVEIDFKVDGRVNSYVTGGGDAVPILSAVRHIVEQELPKILKRIPRLKQVRFRSYVEASSRVSLYRNRAVPIVSRILGPDWRYYGDFTTMGDSHWFYWQHRTVTGLDRVRIHGGEPQEQPDEPYDVGETERFRQAWEKKQQQGVAEGSSDSPQTVTRIDSQQIKDFGSNLKAYKHTDDWSQSGIDTGNDSYWKNKNLKTNTTKGLFAGDPHRTALYATGNAYETRYVEFTQNGQPIVYFDKKDLPKMRGRKTYLTVFDASNFRQLPTGEYFSENPGTPLKQTVINDPFQYIADQGWIVRVTDDLGKVFKQVKNMHKAGKIAQYGTEGMNESKQGVAEGSEQINEYRDRLLQYVKSLLPTWPDYVLKDWLVPNKGDFSNLPADVVKTGIMEKLQGAGLTVNTKWQLVPDMKFTMDMFDPMTKQRLIGRAGGHSDLGLGIPRDKERHATQAALAKQQGGVRKEPVLLIKTPRGYELLEGWHRTIQHFASYPDGYVGPAYVAVSVK